MSEMTEINTDLLIAELKERQDAITRELALLTGRRGTCSSCGEEKEYANRSEDVKLCGKCWMAKKIAEKRPEYEHLIGLKVVDVILSSDYYPFKGLKLEGGHVIEVESDHDGYAYLDLGKVADTSGLINVKNQPRD